MLPESNFLNYDNKYHFFPSIFTLWTILDNEPVINKIKTLNKRNKGDIVATLDFSTLNNKISHNKILKVMYQLIDFCFDAGDNTYLIVTKYGAD